MIRLVSLLKRKPGTTHEEFLQYWRDNHGPLIRNSSAAKYVVRYEQHAAVWPEPAASSPSPTTTCDHPGFRSAEDYWAHMTEPDFGDMWADIEKFLDTSQIHWVITEEPVVVIGDD